MTTSAQSNKVFVIGDIQGCHDQLLELIALIDKDVPQQGPQHAPAPRLLFAGDLVNRGPKSLATLRLIRRLGERADSVLGNHDLHLLAVANGIRKAHRNDTIDDILAAPDREELLNWLRHRPLALFEQDHLLIHAGVFPTWTIAETLNLAHEVEAVLRSDAYVDFLSQMYGNTPDHWSDTLQGADRYRGIVNALTRMRFCSSDGRMDFASKEGMDDTPDGYFPWFDVPGRQTAGKPIAFGHWSTLGLIIRDDLLSLDTGCVWGGKLTAVCLNDQSVVQVDCPQQQKPG